jgi:hypothetical protein
MGQPKAWGGSFVVISVRCPATRSVSVKSGPRRRLAAQPE